MNFRIPLVVASEEGTAQTSLNFKLGLLGFNVGIYTEGEHLGELLKESLWKEEP